MYRSFPSLPRLATTTIIASALATAAFANDDGFFNVSYNDISFSLTQLGEYGELIIEPSGFADMSYGRCVVNFKRDPQSGAVTEMTPVVQQQSATCPEEYEFAVAPANEGLYTITFTKPAQLTSQPFELFPVLRPLSDDMRSTQPKGFDILGATIGQTRAEIEAILTGKGYAPVPGYTEKADYQGGYSKSIELWGKGADKNNPDRPNDMISVTYSPIFAGEDAPEKVEYLARQWNILPSDNLSLANLLKSLEDKHGKTTSSFEKRIYTHAGELAPKEFQPSCHPNIHLQAVSTAYGFIGESGQKQVNPSCGAFIDIMTLDDYEAPGRASMLKIELGQGDTAYEGFWNVWSRGEVKALQERYELQANMTGSGPEL